MESNVDLLMTDHYEKIPMLISAFSCGSGTPFSDGYTYAEVPSKLIRNENCYLLNVGGNSMMPTLQPGDRCLVDVGKSPLHNNIVAAIVDGEFVIKRFRQNGYSDYLFSDNKHYPAIKLDDANSATIIGVVYEILRKV